MEEFSDLPFIDEVVPPVAKALSELGYVTDVHRDIGAKALQAVVTEATGSARVVYVASHGKPSEDNPHRVDVVPADGRVGSGMDAAHWVDDAQQSGVPMLFLFDLCRSGRAARLPHLVHGSQTPVNAWVIAASGTDEDAYDGRFSIALAKVLNDIAENRLDTDPSRSHVSFKTVARQIQLRVEKMSGISQSVHSTPMDPAAEEPDLPFFPNRAFDPIAAKIADVDPALREFLDRDARHFAEKAGTQFVGRRSQLRALAPWLDDVEAGGLRVVTGNPGVGKSALLGVLACAAHPELVAVAERVRKRLWAQNPLGCPSPIKRLAAVHARGRTAGQVLASIAHQLDLDLTAEAAVDASVLAGLLPDAGEVPAVIVDALDETDDPTAVCAELVRLAGAVRSDGRPVVRMVVGTRPWPQFSALLDSARAVDGLIDLDNADPEEVRLDLVDHLTSFLAEMSGYELPHMRAIRDRLAHAVADRLTPPPGHRAEWGSFLVAGIFTRYLKRVRAADSVEAATELGHSVPTTLPRVLDLDLDANPEGHHIRAILAAIAQAKGEGIPLEIALPLAGVFTDIDAAHARALLPDALFYLRTTPDGDGTLLYRLFHQGLVDHLTQPTTGTATPTPDDVLTHLLDTHTTHDGSLRSWDTAPPYLLRHAPAYAQAADRLDELLVDTEFLVHGDPATLVPAFLHAHEALLSRAIYRASIGFHRDTDPATRRRFLALDAARHGATPLTSAFTERAEESTWMPVAATGGRIDPACRDTLTGHTGGVSAVACTVLDGRPIAVTGSWDGTVRVWNLTTGRQHGQPLTGHTGGVSAVACTVLDGRPIAVTGSWDCTVRVWNLTTGDQVGQPLTGHNDIVNAVACTVLDGRPMAVTGAEDDTVRVWNLTDLIPDQVNAVACTVLDGRPIAVTGAEDDTVRVWNLTTGQQHGQPLTGHTGMVNAVACTVLEGRPIAVTGAEDDTVRVWNLTTGQQHGQPLTGHTGGVLAVACTVLEGRPIAVTGAEDDTVRVWNLTTGQQHGQPLTGHTGGVLAVACTVLEGRPIAVTGAEDGTVRVWNLTTGQQHGQPLTGHTGTVNAVACTVLDGRPIAVTGATDETVRVWNLTTGQQHGAPLTGHTSRVDAAACTVLDGRPIAVTGSWDETVRVWDLTTGRQHGRSLTGHTDQVDAVACTVLDRRPIAVTGSWDGTVRVWDLTTGRQHGRSLTGHRGRVQAVACTVLDGRPIAVTGAEDDTVRVWNLTTGRQHGRSLTGHTGGVSAVACTVLDGRPIAVTGASDKTVRVWNLTTGRQRGRSLTGHTGQVYAVACTVLDGRPIAVTGASDKTVRVWNLTTGQQHGAPLTGHTSRVNAVACTVLDGRPIAVTGAEDDAVRIWDLTTGRQHGRPLTGHTGQVYAVACTVLDGRPIAVTGAEDRTVRVWDLTTRQCIDRIPLPTPCEALAAGAGNRLVVGFDSDVAFLTRVSPRSRERRTPGRPDTTTPEDS
ncbi:WD40 repeat domain-containing protein [Nocardia zapadnayensis]|nr:AAA family ATPase [Nocardia zapadnayensis]MCX0274938.1 WD40 repeat domain-containing protein [Nocardia zapadnayensis]